MANSIILNNSGDDSYRNLSREWVAKPVKCNSLKIFLADDTQLSKMLTITSKTSTGAIDIREIGFLKYADASNKNNLNLLIPLTPELILDGNTSFKLSIPALSQVLIMFYYKEVLLNSDLLIK